MVTVFSWLISVVVLGLLVLVHELGHFLVAKRVGVRVLRFSIGFGPIIARWRRGETDYALSLLPLGGYVKMAGEGQEDQRHEPGEFLSQPIGVRAKIVLAGPAVNYLVSIVTLWVVLVVGYPELSPVVGRVIDDMPAQAAGLRVGDRIRAIDHQPITTWDELTRSVRRHPGQPIALSVERAGAPLSLTAVPSAKELPDPFGRVQRVGLLGVSPSGEFHTFRVSPWQAIGATAQRQAEWAGQIAMSLWALFTGRASPRESLTGPIGILHLTSEAARMGVGALLYLVSLFSLSLAVFNLFPLPVLDGGHLFFMACEKLRGRPISVRWRERATQVSVAFLLALVVMVCINDLVRLGVVDKVATWWKS